MIIPGKKWIHLLFWQLEVRTPTYGPEIDQSQHAKSVSHIIKKHIVTHNNIYFQDSFVAAVELSVCELRWPVLAQASIKQFKIVC